MLDPSLHTICAQVVGERRMICMNATRLIFIALVMFGLASANARASGQSQHHLAKRQTSKTVAPQGAEPVAFLSDAEDERRYQEVKVRAMADPQVRQLKEKSDTATSEAEVRDAAIAYNRALFTRMRELDRTVSERAGLVENLIIRRINE